MEGAKVYPTFQIQILGTSSGLGGDLGVNFYCVKVVGVPGDHHIVPLVII